MSLNYGVAINASKTRSFPPSSERLPSVAFFNIFLSSNFRRMNKLIN